MSTKQKGGSKASTVKPIIKKLSNVHKKWLSQDTFKPPQQQAQENSKKADVDKNLKNLKLIDDGYKTLKKGFDHYYENIKFCGNLDEEKYGNLFMDTSIESNVTVVEVSLNTSSSSVSRKSLDNKLKGAIDSFDKILDEFSPPKPTRIPKLQKSKTCSIIESKCILKKTSSVPLQPKTNANALKTKSMHDLADLNLYETKKEEAEVKGLINQNQKMSNEKEPAKILKKVDSGGLKVVVKTSNKPNNKIKETIEKFEKGVQNNAQTVNKEGKGLKDIIQKFEEKKSSQKVDEFFEKPISRAKSCFDVSNQANKKISRIPVMKSSLKAYPSTPSNLNKLDNLGSTGKLNLKSNSNSSSSAKLSIAKNNSSDMKMKSRSVQNLSSSSTSTMSVFSTAQTSTPKAARPLAKQVKAKSTRNLSKMSISGEQQQQKKMVISEPLGKPPSGLGNKSKSLTNVNNNNKKLSLSPQEVKLKQKASHEAFSNNLTLNNKKPALVKTLSTQPLIKEKVAGKNAVANGEDKKSLSSPQEKRKTAVPQNVIKLEVENVKPDQKDLNTFGVKKATLEPKFGGISKNSTYKVRTSNFILRDLAVGSSPKSNLKRTDTYKVDKNNAKNNKSGEEKLRIVEIKDAICDTEKAGDENDSSLDDIDSCLINKDYSSDDNSDDSGNISNEIEEDSGIICEKVLFSSDEHLDEMDEKYKDDSSLASSEASGSRDNPNSIEGFKTSDEIFFRSGILAQLEAQRDEKLADKVVNLQAHCRGYLARKKLTQRKLQDLAVRCIQRNVRKFMSVRDWPWWRLLVRVTPLLNVHRTEEELKIKTEELEALKAKLEKIENDRTTLKHENDKLEAKLSEMTADLAEEHSTSTLAAERLDAETSERIRLERELNELQHKNKTLSQASERLEMELIYAKSELNGISEDEGEGDEDGGVYKQRYERAVRELEFTKRRLQQQHEDDLEQLVALKKQLEKKLTDAYEDVDEQRQVVGQWKRKVQKLNSETNDLRLLLEEQTARNNLLEKKQRKFDSETQLLHDELRQEKQNKDRILREKELLNSEKFSLESSLADTRMELEMKEEKLAALQREFDEVTYGGKTEEEVTLLRKQKIDLDRRCHDQEEELDELAGQVQLLEQAKLKLEMSLEQQRKASKKEAQQHDEELEEVRCNAQKKVKALEAQLESEHEERTLLLREKHELERRLAAVAESDRNEKACDEALLHRLKRDLKRTKILLKDTQAQLERQKAENPNKNLIRQLRNQLEDAECARAIALKAKQTLEADLNETQSALDEANKFRSEAEERCNALSREKTDLQAQVEEGEEELAEVLKKYKGAVQQMSMDQMALQEQVSLVAELEVERNQLKDQLNELTSRLESAESLGDASSNLMLKRTELKVKELESKLELEQTTRGRLDVQIARLKEALDKLQTEFAAARAKEQQAQDQARKLQRSLREAKEELSKSQAKEAESMQKRKELEKKCESFETEAAAARTDLRLALKRIEDLQSAIQGELEDTSTEHSDSEQDSYSSDESVSTFLANHKVGSKMDRSPTSENSHKLTSTSRSSTSSTLTKDSSYT